MKMSSFLKNFLALSLLMAAFAFTSLHAQTVAYVVNNNSNSVSVINTATNTVTATIAVGSQPEGVVFSPDGTRAYVTDPPQHIGAISVINTASNSVIATITLGTGVLPVLPAITPDGKSLYVPDDGHNTVIVVDTATNTVSATIPVGTAPRDVVITPDGARAYVGNELSGTVSVIDTASKTVVGSPISVAASSQGMFLAMTPDGRHIYVSPEGGSTIFVIDTATNTVSTTISGVTNSGGLAVTPDGASVYITNIGAGKVAIIDTATNTVQPGLISVGAGPTGVAITPDGAFVYVTNNAINSATVSAIATATNTVVATVTVGSQPFGIATANLKPPPTAVAGPNQTITVDQTVHLDGSGSFAPNTLPANLQYAWSFVSRPAGSSAVLSGANTATPSFVADAIGTYVVKLVVTDPATNEASRPSQVTISSVWSPPTANAGAAQSVTTGALVNLNGLGSTDPNGLPLTYAWSFVSQPNGSAATITPGTPGLASFTADVAGSYTVQLVVSDPFGSSQPATVVITATTPETSQQLIQDAINYIATIPCSHFDACGHRNALTNQLQQAIIDIQNNKTDQAIGKLNDSIIRTDGFPLRGSLDGDGPGMDWITDQTDQNFVYGKLTAALNLLQQPI
jgi:YVTN family beta-propeller protein